MGKMHQALIKFHIIVLMHITYNISTPLSNKILNALYRSAWPNHKEMDFTQELTHAFFYVTAHDGEKCIGFVKVIWDGGQHGFILEPTVHPDYQRQGIGTQLLEQLKKEGKKRNLVWLHVDFHPHLLKYYRNAGFLHTEAGLLNLND